MCELWLISYLSEIQLVNFFPLMQWALHTLKKPILTINWLYQCCNEHRIVPQESFRVLPVSGLKICVTRIPSGFEVGYLL